MTFDKKAYDKEYQKTHRERNNLARRKWVNNHPEEARKLNTEAHRKWREKNREKYNAYQREYRRKRKGVDDNSQT